MISFRNNGVWQDMNHRGVYIARLCVTFLFLVMACIGVAGQSGLIATPEDVLRLLAGQGIPHDTTNLYRAAVKAMLKEADPYVIMDEAEPRYSAERNDPEFEEWPGEIGYIRIKHFQQGVGAIVVETIAEWLKKRQMGVIIDLRSASGTDLESVDKIAGVFLPEGTELYSVRDFNGNVTHAHRALASAVEESNLLAAIIAVDSDTRGAGEILAAVLKNIPGIMVVGWHTRGDFAIRERVLLANDSAVCLTVSRIVCAGHEGNLHGKPVEPDISITTVRLGGIPDRPRPGRVFSEKEQITRDLMRKVADDPVLGMSVDILLGLRAIGYRRVLPEGASASQ